MGEKVIDFQEARSKRDLKLEPYNFAKSFELALTYLICTDPEFFSKVGHAIDPDLLATPEGKLGVGFAQDHARDRGQGPSNLRTVIQRGSLNVREGKLTEEKLEKFYLEMEKVDRVGVDEEEILTELLPLLKRRGRREIMLRGLERVGKGQDLIDISKQIEMVELMGVISSMATSLKLDVHSLSKLKDLCYSERLNTGIPELDSVLDGGPPIGTLSYVLGGTGEGKSIFLNHVAMHALKTGLNVAWATLELASEYVISRMFAALTGIPEVVVRDADSATAEKILRQTASMNLGSIDVEYFDSESTTVNTIKEWVEKCEEKNKSSVDVVVIDYDDLLISHRPVRNDYEKGIQVSRSLHKWAAKSKKWIWTGSQSVRKKQFGKSDGMKDVNDTAGSMGRPREADLMITLNQKIDDLSGYREMIYGIAKFRMGRAGAKIGPLPTDFEHSRMVPIAQ